MIYQPVETEIQVDPRQQEMEQAKEIILSTSRLFLRNLTFTVTTEELEEAFSSFGELEQVHIYSFLLYPQPRRNPGRDDKHHRDI